MRRWHNGWLSVTVILVTSAVLILQQYVGMIPDLLGVAQQLLVFAVWLIPPLAMLLVWYGPGRIDLGHELGLAAEPVTGLGRATVAAAPFGLAAAIAAAPGFPAALGLAERALLVAGLEGFLFRGFLFGQLYRRAGWGFVPAVTVGPLLLLLMNFLEGGPLRLDAFLLPLAVNAFLAWLWLEGDHNLWLSAGSHFWLHWGDGLLGSVAAPELAWLVRLMEAGALVWAAALIWGHRRARGGCRLSRHHLLRNPGPASG
ncbi:MAG: hypothetical protein JXQ27_08515 [Acidobacteria bacterium]|nr:hypothetical protein [Acidobacteriota bacterium]